MYLDQQMRAMRRELAEQAAYHREQLEYLPPGKIVFLKNGDYVKWMHRDTDARSGGTVIARRNRPLAADLSMKNYHLKMAETLETQIRLVDQMLLDASAAVDTDLLFLTSDLLSEVVDAISAGIEYANKRVLEVSGAVPAGVAATERTASKTSATGASAMDASSAETSIPANSRHHAQKDLLTPLLLKSAKWMTDWCREAYECGDRHLKELRVRAKCGLLVRSKSEVFIADWLFEHRIPFHYEQVLRIGDYVFCPDFTILLPDGTLIFWEHFGALSKSGYLLDTQKKLARYLEAGIYPGRDLLITCEDGDNPLDLRSAEWILQMLCSKYKSAVPFGGASEVPLMI